MGIPGDLERGGRRLNLAVVYVRLRLAFIQQMSDGQNRVAEQHSRARVSHDFSDPLSHVLLVAVDGAIGADWLVLLKWTAAQTMNRVIQQRPAFITRWPLVRVMPLTVDFHHRRNRAFFTINGHLYLPHNLAQRCSVADEHQRTRS